MTDTSYQTILSLQNKIRTGNRKIALDQINKVLSTTNPSEKTIIDYKILKAIALTKSDLYLESEVILIQVEDDLGIKGTELQKLDYLLTKIENLLIFGKNYQGMNLVKEAETLIKKVSEVPPEVIEHKMIDLLLLKSSLTANIHGYTKKLDDILELSLKKSIESSYDYGKARTLEKLASSFFEKGNREEATSCVEEAYNIWNFLNNKDGIAYAIFLKGLLMSNSDPDKARHMLEQSLEMNEDIDAKLTMSKIHNSLAILLFQKNKGETAVKHLETSIKLKREIGDKHGLILLLYNIGQLFISTMDYEKALTYLQEGLELTQELDYKRPYYLIQFALNTLYIKKGELNKALRFLNEALTFYEEKNMQENVVWIRERLANVQVLKGDLDSALENYLLCKKFYDEENKIPNICNIFNNIAEIHQLKGNYSEALKYYERGEKKAVKNKNYYTLAKITYNLTSFYLEMNQIQEAKLYLNALTSLANKLKSKKIEVMADLAEALVIIDTEDNSRREEAKKLLRKTISRENLEYKFTSTAILNLCSLLLSELRETEDPDLLIELKKHVELMYKESSDELAYPLLIQSIWLKANIALVELKIEEATSMLKNAQDIAEAKEFYNLARRISNSHDNLLEQLEQWMTFTMNLPTIAERMELTHIESVLNDMVQSKGIIQLDDPQEEEVPILLLILNSVGSVIYIKSLETEINPELIETIWTSLLESTEEEVIVSGIIQRRKMNGYTYVVKKVESLIFVYLFMGHSYVSLKKIEEFSRLVYGTSELWEELEETSKFASSTDFDLITLLEATSNERVIEASSKSTLDLFVDSIFLK